MPLMAWVGLGWSAWLTWSPKNHPTLRRLERASPGATSRLLDTFDGSAFVIARDPLWVSREAAVLFMPWSFEARFMDELAWVHPTVTKVVTPLHSSQYLSLTLRFRRAPDLDIGVSEDELKALNRMLTEAWPRVVVGWSEEREKLWMRDRERFGTHAS